jgi:hypothetical protein
MSINKQEPYNLRNKHDKNDNSLSRLACSQATLQEELDQYTHRFNCTEQSKKPITDLLKHVT